MFLASMRFFCHSHVIKKFLTKSYMGHRLTQKNFISGRIMRVLKTFTSSLLLATTPSLLAYPHNTPPSSAFVQKVSNHETQNKNDYTLSYDDVLNLLDEIESGALEKKCTPEELEKVKHFVAFLAKEGTLGENTHLDSDIEDLLSGDKNLY